jgi:prepilin-type N-terminal cleavage/methylation domain-containing protein
MVGSKFLHRLNFQLKGNKGFTLIELTMVIVVLGILMSMAYKNYSGITKNATKESANYDDAVRKQKVERDLAISALGLTPAPAFDPPPNEFTAALTTPAEQ